MKIEQPIAERRENALARHAAAIDWTSPPSQPILSIVAIPNRRWRVFLDGQPVAVVRYSPLYKTVLTRVDIDAGEVPASVTFASIERLILAQAGED